MINQPIEITDILIESFLIPSSSPELGKTFEDLFPNIYPKLREVLPGEKAFKSQERCAKFMFKGQDFLLNAETSGGKTESVILPALELIYLTKYNQIQGTEPMKRLGVFLPTKPLLQSLQQRLGHRYQITDRLGIKFLRYDGDLNESIKEKRRKVAVQQQPEILLTTPDQFYMSISQGKGPWLEFLLDIDTLWIDELDMYSGKTLFNLELLVKLLRLHHEVKGKKLQVVITGATIPNPQHIIDRFLYKGAILHGKGQHGETEVALFRIPKPTHPAAYNKAISKISAIIDQIIASNKKFVFFIDPRFSTEIFALEKSMKLLKIAPFHAKLDSYTKQRILEQFRAGEIQGLFCTSLLEVGIDIGDLEIVILFGVPFEPERGALQRIGRVARRPNMQGQVFFILPLENRVSAYYAINPDKIKKLLLSKTPHPLKPLPLYDCVEECVIAFISLALKLEITDLKLLQKRLLPYNVPLFTRALTELFCDGAINEIDGKLIPICNSTLAERRLNNRFRECGEVFTLFYRDKNVGEMEKWRVPVSALPGCYFVHGGITYKVNAISCENKSIQVIPVDDFRLSRNKTTLTMHQDCIHQSTHQNYTLTYGPCIITEKVETLRHENLLKDTIEYKRCIPPFTMNFHTMGLSIDFKKTYKTDLIQFFKEILKLNVDLIGVSPTHLNTLYHNNRLYIFDKDRPRGAALFLFHHFTKLTELLTSSQVRFVFINEYQKLRNLIEELKGPLCKVW